VLSKALGTILARRWLGKIRAGPKIILVFRQALGYVHPYTISRFRWRVRSLII
jgi:hypothetical protein